jgi:capsular exopolysaccharide synthesis family protein
MVVTADSTVPRRAAAIANAYATAYLQYRQGRAVDTLAGAAKTLQGRINALQGQINSLNDQVLAASPDQRSTVQASVGPQVTALSQQIATLNQQMSQLQSGATSGQAGAQIVKPADTPTSPASPQRVRNGLLGLGGGLVLGIALAFVREALDDTITTRQDIDRAQPGLPVLGLIPAVASRQRNGNEVVSAVRPHSAAAEAYRSLRTAIQFLGLDRPLRTLQVTSPRTSEGKTTTIANLGVTLAGAGQRVIMVSCDLRRPLLHEFFRATNDVGFTSVLLGTTPLSRAVQDVNDLPGLQLLASGPKPPNPSELLGGQRAAEVLSTLCDSADLVLVDSPPALAVTDAVVLAPRLDATLVVIGSGATTRRDLASALELLGQVDAPVVGAVLNSVTTESAYGYRSGYVYGYGVPSPPEGAPQPGPA